jgi:hypothetical protein
MPTATSAGAGPKRRLNAAMSAGSPVKDFGGGILDSCGTKIAINYASGFGVARFLLELRFFLRKYGYFCLSFSDFPFS